MRARLQAAMLLTLVLLSAAADASPGRNVGSIHGTVFDATPHYPDERFAALERADTKEALEKAFVAFILPEPCPMPGVPVVLRRGTEVRRTVTNEEGKYRFSDLPLETYQLAARVRRGLFTRTVVPTQVDLGAWSDWAAYRRLDLKVDLGYRPDLVTLKGSLTDTAGRSVAGARVIATQCRDTHGLGHTPIHIHTVSTLSDKDGCYELKGLIPAPSFRLLDVRGHDYTVRVEAPGYVEVEMHVPAESKREFLGARRLLEIVPTLAARFAKEFAGHEPKPLLPAGAGAPPGSMDFQLHPAAVISGMAVDGDGEPRPQTTLWVRRQQMHSRDTLVKRFNYPRFAGTDERGRFRFPGLPPGDYEIVSIMDVKWGNVYFDNGDIILGSGEEKRGLRFVVAQPPPGRIEGTVVDFASGEPITNFAAEAEGVIDTGGYPPGYGELRLDDERPGGFVVEGVSVGKAQVEFTAPGYARAHLEVGVESDRTAAPRVRLKRLPEDADFDQSAVRVRVTQNGIPICAGIEAFSLESDSASRSGVVSDEEGWATISDLNAERHVVRATLPRGPSGKNCTRIAATRVDVRAGKTTEALLEIGGQGGLLLAFAAPRELRMSFQVAPEGTPGAAFELPDERNPDLCARGYSFGTWTHRIEHLPAGEYRVRVRPAAYYDRTSSGEQIKTVFVESEQTNSVTFAFE